MSKTKKPTGLKIARQGNRFTLTWKLGDTDYGNGQQFSYMLNRASKSDAWSRAKNEGARVTSEHHTISASDYFPHAGKPKLASVKMRVRGNRKEYSITQTVKKNGKKKQKTVKVNPGWSDWEDEEFKIKVPDAPKVVAALDDTLSNRSSFSVTVSISQSSEKMFTDIVYQSMLVKDCTEKNGSKLTWKQKSGNSWKTGTLSGTNTVVITEETETLAKGSYTRWFRAKARGPAGESTWVYDKHVYADPRQAKIKGVPKTSPIAGGYKIEVVWEAAQPRSNPIDKTTVQYRMAVPEAGMICPADDNWQDGKVSADTKGKDTAVILVDGRLEEDQCLFVRVNTTHDTSTVRGEATLCLAGNVKDPSGLSVTGVDVVTRRATISAQNNSDIPDAFLAVVFRTDRPGQRDVIVGIIPPGQQSVMVTCPAWAASEGISFGVYAAVGSYQRVSRSDGVTAYNVTARMRSASTEWDGGAVPKAPTGVTVVATDKEGVVQVGWNWSWDRANGAELSWADHDDAWESTDEPESYTISGLHASRWKIAGLETGKTWYVRVRLLNETSGDNAVAGPWSNTVQVDLATTPITPVLALSEGVIPVNGTVTASWAFSAEDGTTQTYAEICEAVVTEQGISYGRIVAHTETMQHLEISAKDAGWSAGETHQLCVRVMSSAGKMSDAWSAPVAVTVAEQVTASILSTSLETVTVVEAGEERQALSLTQMPLTVVTQGAGAGGTTIVAIERVGNYHMRRPDETELDGFDGETIAKKTVSGEGEVVISAGELILALDDGANYKISVTVKDGLGQTATTELGFEVHWSHQAIMPRALARVDQDNYVAMIELLAPEGAIDTDTCDIYRLSMDRPELIVRGGELGKTYVDPYPTIGDRGGHRVVFRTANGDYITEDQRPAWIDLGEDAYDVLELNENVIDFDGQRVAFTYNVDLSNKWGKDFQETDYLDGSVQGDWNPAVRRETTISTVVLTEDEETIRAFRRLAVYPGICHVRTLDGSSFAADVQVQQDMKHSEAHRMSAFSVTIKRVDPEGLDGIRLEEWF
jgi:hypothetical protein